MKNFTNFSTGRTFSTPYHKPQNSYGLMVLRSYALMVFLLLPLHTFAQFSGGNGTPAEPYKIAIAADLMELASFVNNGNTEYNAAHYILTADIDLGIYQSGAGWMSIGNKMTTPFKGKFNGDNKKITGLKINSKTWVFVGLFGCIEGGTIENLGIEDAEVISLPPSGETSAGILVGSVYAGSTILHCYTTGFVFCGTEAATLSVGGITGSILNSQMNKCYSKAEVVGYAKESFAHAGGLAGISTNNAAISNSYSTGLVKACNSGNYYVAAGGVVGYAQTGNIAKCYSTANIRARNWDYNGTSYSGGVVGYLLAGAKVSDCAALNPLISCWDNVMKYGRIAGESTGTLENNIAFDKMVNPLDETSWEVTPKNGTDIIAPQIINDGTLGNRFLNAAGWNIEDGKLPGLFGNAIHLPIFLQYRTGNSSQPYLIKVADDLESLADYVNFGNITNNKYYKIENNIDLSAYPNWNPIGTRIINIELLMNFSFIRGGVFSGNFDGNSKKITGLKINSTKFEQGIGLFGNVGGGTIENLFIEEANIKDMHYSVCTGVLAGLSVSSKIFNCYTTGQLNTQTTMINVFTSVSFTGGLLGISEGNILSNCYSTVNVNNSSNYNSYAGGLVGASGNEDAISNCYATGNVVNIGSKISAAGGLAGYIYSLSKISNCYAIGAVSSSSDTIAASGGIAGVTEDDPEVAHCAALNPSISCTGGIEQYFGRVTGISVSSSTLNNNIAFAQMINPLGSTTWGNIGLNDLDGKDFNKEQINADGTLEHRFYGIPWTTANGKLPGLFNKTVDMPPHLRLGDGIASAELSNQITVLPNPTTGELTIENGELRINNVEIFDVMGRKIPLQFIEGVDGAAGRGSKEGWTAKPDGVVINISHFPAGIYFLKITTETGIVTKKVIKQ